MIPNHKEWMISISDWLLDPFSILFNTMMCLWLLNIVTMVSTAKFVNIILAIQLPLMWCPLDSLNDHKLMDVLWKYTVYSKYCASFCSLDDLFQYNCAIWPLIFIFTCKWCCTSQWHSCAGHNLHTGLWWQRHCKEKAQKGTEMFQLETHRQHIASYTVRFMIL